MSRDPRMSKQWKQEEIPGTEVKEPEKDPLDAAVELAAFEVTKLQAELQTARLTMKKLRKVPDDLAHDRAVMDVVDLERALLKAQRAEKLARAARARKRAQLEGGSPRF